MTSESRGRHGKRPATNLDSLATTANLRWSMPNPKPRREAEIQAAIMAWCGANRIPCLRMNPGAFSGEHKGKRRYVRFGVKGMADLLILLPPNGRAGFIEVKAMGGRLTREQQWFLSAMDRARAFTAVVRSPEDLADVLLSQGYEVT